MYPFTRSFSITSFSVSEPLIDISFPPSSKVPVVTPSLLIVIEPVKSALVEVRRLPSKLPANKSTIFVSGSIFTPFNCVLTACVAVATCFILNSILCESTLLLINSPVTAELFVFVISSIEDAEDDFILFIKSSSDETVRV